MKEKEDDLRSSNKKLKYEMNQLREELARVSDEVRAEEGNRWSQKVLSLKGEVRLEFLLVVYLKLDSSQRDEMKTKAKDLQVSIEELKRDTLTLNNEMVEQTKICEQLIQKLQEKNGHSSQSFTIEDLKGLSPWYLEMSQVDALIEALTSATHPILHGAEHSGQTGGGKTPGATGSVGSVAYHLMSITDFVTASWELLDAYVRRRQTTRRRTEQQLWRGAPRQL